VKQGLRVIVEAAEFSMLSPLRGKVRIVICGDGAERGALAQLVAEKGLMDVLTLLPLQTRVEYEEMLVDADVCLITQQAGSGRAFFPSKLLTTLAFARPVVTVADPESELVRALNEGGFGVNVQPGNPKRLAKTLVDLSSDGVALAKMSQRGREYVSQVSAERVFGEFEQVLEGLAPE
jgi:colanic acid biosynthesis glycosyl transferase WcaI